MAKLTNPRAARSNANLQRPWRTPPLPLSGDFIAAAGAGRTAISLDPAPGEPYLSLGNALIGQGQYSAAVEPLRAASERLPGNATIHNSLGVALLESGQLTAAETSLRRTVELMPTLIEGHSNLSHLLNLLHLPEDAAAHAWRAVELDANFAAGWNNLAGALLALDQPEEALTAAERAIELSGESVEAENTLGSALAALARDGEARAAFERALKIAPDNAEVHFNHALSLLTAGEYSTGFSEYEWRLKLGGDAISHFTTAMWDGAPLDGATILLRAEQGFGDCLQFIRFAPPGGRAWRSRYCRLSGAVAPFAGRRGGCQQDCFVGWPRARICPACGACQPAAHPEHEPGHYGAALRLCSAERKSLAIGRSGGGTPQGWFRLVGQSHQQDKSAVLLPD